MADDALKQELSQAERIELIERLDRFSEDQPVSRELWAILWLADVDQLRYWVNEAEGAEAKGGDPTHTLTFLELYVKEAKVAQTWMQRTRSRASSAASSPRSASRRSVNPLTPIVPKASLETPSQASPSTPPSAGSKRKRSDEQGVRSKVAVKLCCERDNMQCIVTQSGPPIEAAHIFPFSMRNLQSDNAMHKRLNPWRVLKLFWNKDRVDRWYEAVAGPGTEPVQNMFCLAPNTHKYHERAYFALRPVETEEQDQKLAVQFYWLPWVNSNNAANVHLSTRPSLPSSPDFRTDDAGRIVKLLNVRTNRTIACGDIITMDTADPERLPLPDVGLLDLQWVLQRVVALRGGAEPEDLQYDDDDSYGVSLESDDGSISDCSLSEPTATLSSPRMEKRSQLLEESSPSR